MLGLFTSVFLLLFVLVLGSPCCPSSPIVSGGHTFAGSPVLPVEQLMLSLDTVGFGAVMGVLEFVLVAVDSMMGSVGMSGSVGLGGAP